MKTEKIRVFIVDDHDLFRQGVKNLLANTQKFEVVGEAVNGKDFIEKIDQVEHDIVLMDIAMPEMDGIEATAWVRSKKPDIKILALTMYGEEKYYYQMIQNGIKGFVLKSAGINELITAIESVVEGNNFFSSELLIKLVHNISINYVEEKQLLSAREVEVLRYIAEGLTNEEIAEKLHISPATVRTHRSNLISKTGCKNSASLVMWAIKNKIVDVN